jgi:hypothetical protein
MKKLVFGLMAGLLVSTVALAQDEAKDDSDSRPEPERRHIQVLNDPHDIASFYRSSSSSPYTYDYTGGFAVDPLTDRASMTERYAIAGAYRQNGGSSRYPIASFYRQNGGQGRYSRFWVSNGGSRFGTRSSFRSRRIGPSELCLFAPTLLAPVAPFTGR